MGRGLLSELTRCKQLTFGPVTADMTPISSPKWDLLHAMLTSRAVFRKGAAATRKKFIIASQFTSHLNWIEQQLGDFRVLKITGDVTGRRRDDAVREFRGEGGSPLLLLQHDSGVSITLDEHCDEMFILDEDWIEDVMVQLRGRIDNRGRRIAPRTFHYLRTRDTIDEKMAENNLAQASVANQLLDGRRGVDVARRLLGRS
jgi:SNF2 family DNA or RNA helicase